MLPPGLNIAAMVYINHEDGLGSLTRLWRFIFVAILYRSPCLTPLIVS
jgi:hypothetical protein